MNYENLTPLRYDVLSNQSQDIYGTVGNNAARPWLQAYCFNVMEIPTVLLSNTPHYPTMHGGIVPADWFAAFLRGLEERNALADLRAIMLGYLGDSGQADLLIPFLKQQKARNPGLQISIDPVLGDRDSGLYVKEELADSYRHGLIDCADLITPNIFELAYLSGMPVNSQLEILAAGQRLLATHRNLESVIVTSVPVEDANQLGNMLIERDGHYLTRHPRIDCAVKGTGDSFHAILVGEMLNNDGKDRLKLAVKWAGEIVAEALEKTAANNFGELAVQETIREHTFG